MNNLEEVDKFLEKYNFPKLNQKEIEKLNRPIPSMEIETVIRNLPGSVLESCTFLRICPFLPHCTFY